MTGTARIIRGNALALPLADASVDLICTRHGTDGSTLRQVRDRTITGYACGCAEVVRSPAHMATSDANPPTRSAVILDPFGGTEPVSPDQLDLFSEAL